MTCCSAAFSLFAAQFVRIVPDLALQRGFGAFLILLVLCSCLDTNCPRQAVAEGDLATSLADFNWHRRFN